MTDLLPRRPLADPAADALAAHLDPLTARVCADELAALAPRLAAGRPLSALVAVMEEELGARRVCLHRVEAVQRRALGLAADARQELVIEALRDEPGGGRREVAAAVRGRLDLAALLERLGARAEGPAVRLELCCRLAPALAAADGERAALGPLLALLRDLAGDEPRRPTRRAAIVALATLLGRPDAPADPRGHELLGRLLRDEGADPWLRRAALEVVPHLPDRAAEAWLVAGLSAGRSPGAVGSPDAALVRARAAELALDRPTVPLDPALRALRDDDSELVRFTLADGLARRVARGAPGSERLAAELLATADERTRARLAWALHAAGTRGLELLAAALGGPPLVARFALDAACEALMAGVEAPDRLVEAAGQVPAGEAASLRRRRELLRCLLALRAHPLQALAAELAGLDEGQQAVLTLPAGATANELARALVPHAAQGFGFHLDPERGLDHPGDRLTVTRGDTPVPAAWRVIDELRRPAPAKRQAWSHAVGRADRGPLRVPPGGLAEATPTGVAGQRVHSETADGWAPEVPLVEDLLHALANDEILLVGPRGATRIRGPRGPRRLWTRLRLTWSFRRYDQVRLAALEEEEPSLAEPWRRALERLGFEVQAPAPAPPARAWVDPLSFALGMSGSTLSHLSLVVLLLAGLLFGRLAWSGHRLRRARAAVPLVLGGWGTRGKSGTERLKAGLMEALGVPYVSKTTGCEAMILHAPPGGRARELFLYRPYDKATIWEQAEVTALAPRLGARVLLWECMALNPAYVELLQGRWMRDDVSTLTNAFPDHEDIQGPTGQDVARVIAGFAPRGGRLLTTERGMLPILRSVAAARGTPVVAVPPAEHALMPRDLLARFRHREHPANVALVAAMAEGLGLHRVEAIGWMAERVVADVGALVVHPPVDTEGRRVCFAQGMSANDPLSFRHSWREAGFLEACPPDEWRVTVVNNRADRIARSRMFAGLLAEDAAAHAHVLIGTNLDGLRAYVGEAVRELLGRLDLARTSTAERLVAHLRLAEAGPPGVAVARRLGVAEPALASWAERADLLPDAPPRWAACLATARELAGPVARAVAAALPDNAAPYAGELEEHLVRLAARALARRALLAARPAERGALFAELVDHGLVTVPSSAASGDHIIATALRAAPPGAFVRLIGLQNIKGTGLDFAYRWVEWGTLHPLLDQLATAQDAERERLLAEVGTRSYGSVMAVDGAWAALARLPGESDTLRAARAHLQDTRQRLLQARRQGGQARGRGAELVRVLERALDPLDGVRRRAWAHEILGELAAGRISHDRAQAELAALVGRQKGGWLLGKKGT